MNILKCKLKVEKKLRIKSCAKCQMKNKQIVANKVQVLKYHKATFDWCTQKHLFLFINSWIQLIEMITRSESNVKKHAKIDQRAHWL